MNEVIQPGMRRRNIDVFTFSPVLQGMWYVMIRASEAGDPIPSLAVNYLILPLPLSATSSSDVPIESPSLSVVAASAQYFSARTTPP